MPEESHSAAIGNNFAVTIKLGFLIQIFVYVVSIGILLAVAKSDSREALNLGHDAITTTKEHERLLNDMNQRLMKLETQQADFQNMYQHDASRYIRDLNDRYNKLQSPSK